MINLREMPEQKPNPIELMRAGHYFQQAESQVFSVEKGKKNSFLEALVSLRCFLDSAERLHCPQFDGDFYQRMGDNFLQLHLDLLRCGFQEESHTSLHLAQRCYNYSLDI